ncbi:unnamed protein product, partial [Effrenium voratum]
AAFPSKLKVRTFFADVKESEGKEPKDEIPAGKDCSAKTCKRCECPRCPICPECPDGFKPREKVPLASTEGKIASKEDNCPSCLDAWHGSRKAATLNEPETCRNVHRARPAQPNANHASRLGQRSNFYDGLMVHRCPCSDAFINQHTRRLRRLRR